MISVFIGGSREISKLNDLIRHRIRNVIEQDYQILIGDANGADKAVQKYLFESHYINVVVYCMGQTCRNNLGKWPTIQIPIPAGVRGFKLYSIKDGEMSKHADYGLMLWDGKSSGTLNNIISLLKENKKCLVYFSPEKAFITISSIYSLKELLNKCDSNILSQIDDKIHFSNFINSLVTPMQLSINF